MTRRAVISLTLIALLWANLPYLSGYLNATPANHFGGFFLYEQDGYSYLAKMRQGAQGAWDFHLPYTSEDEYQAGGLALMFYIVVGKLAVLGLDYPFIYHSARLLSSLFLLIVLWRFIGRFIVNDYWKTLTWGLLLLSGGWGLLFSTVVDPKYVAYELIAPDAHLFTILYGPPHVIFGFALMLVWISYTLDSFQADRTQLPLRLAVANLLGGITALSREAYGPVFAGLFAAYLIALTIQRRRIPWHEGFIAAASSILAGAYGVYMLIAYRVIPGFAAWYQQNPFESPALIDFVLGFAPLLILALLGRRTLAALPASSERTLLVAWLFAAPIMTYLPIAISRRMIAGWQLPLSIFAAYGLLQLWRQRRLLAAVVAISLIPATLLIIVGGYARVSTPQPPLFITAAQRATLEWLDQNATSADIVLSEWRFGNLVPAYVTTRVFVGHPIETIFFDEKEAATRHFFTSDMPDNARLEFLDRWQITLVVTDSNKYSLSLGAPVFRAENYIVYRR